MSRRRETPSQTAGPYVHIGLTPKVVGINQVFAADLGEGPMFPADAKGERIKVEGRVIDGTGAPTRDACLEFWQADAEGHYHTAPPTAGAYHGRGFMRTAVDPVTGVFAVETIKPGRTVLADGRAQAPHIAIVVFARGINVGLHTRLYFGDEDEANHQDPILNRIDPPQRASTLVAVRTGNTFRFDVVLQGPQETVFFDI